MNPRSADVYLDDRLAGHISAGLDRRGGGCIFRYVLPYLEDASLPPLDPGLPKDSAATMTERMPGALADASPDRWGRYLISRYFREKTRMTQRLTPVDYLWETNDATRQGAIRLRDDGGDYIASPRAAIPTLTRLPELAKMAESLDRGDDAVAVTSSLLAAGGSGGGAQPKISVEIDGDLWIAKFPRLNETATHWEENWEEVASRLASRAGIRVPEHRLLRLGEEYSAFLVQRFDREGARRIHYWSALTATEAPPLESPTYEDMVAFLEEHGSRPDDDIRELWCRIALEIIVGDTDDHGRNHGFLWDGSGWRLSPAFDINPTTGGESKELTLLLRPGVPVDGLTALITEAPIFRIDDPRSELRRIQDAVAEWEDIAEECEIPADACDEMRPNFERGLALPYS